MKILQVINSLATGGAEKLLLEALPLHNEKGIIMDILVLNGKEHPFLKELKKLECCNVISLGNKSVYNPLQIFKIIPFLKKYDIVHVHLFPAQYWVVLAKIISFSKTKLLFTEHSTSNRRIKNNWLKPIDRFFYRKYSKIICITNEVFNVIQEHTSLSKLTFKIIKNGVAIEKFKEAVPFSKNEFFKEKTVNIKLLIQISSFQEPKDQVTLIASLPFLPINVKLLLVGEGILKESCEALVQKLQLSERVVFLGLRMDVPRLLKTADIIVLSSKYEGLSLSSIEGMASGRPFVASDVPGLTEIVAGAGVLFELGNAVELAEKIMKLLNDNDYYDLVSEACQKRASQYDIHKMIDEHIALYESIR